MADEAVRIDERDGLETEILREKAETLIRISRTLDALVGELDRLGVAIDSAPDEGAPSVAEFNAVRERALLYFWYLLVQREAVGFHRHGGLQEFYPIPPAR